MTNGWIKLHRQFTDWEWYTDINVKVVFLHCLLSANHELKKWRGVEIKQGQFITSLEHLAIEVGLTIQQVRTALKKLKSTSEITCETTSQYSIITINKWNEYQTDNTQDNKQITNDKQTSNKRVTTNKNDKNDKNNNKHIYGEFKNVKLTDEEFGKLKEVYQSKLNDAIEVLSSYLESKGDKYKSHYAVLGKHNWVYKKIFTENKSFSNNRDELIERIKKNDRSEQ